MDLADNSVKKETLERLIDKGNLIPVSQEQPKAVDIELSALLDKKQGICVNFNQ